MKLRIVRYFSLDFLSMSVLSMIGLSGMAQAEEADMITMDETYISGNQELPKVLYILPWKNQQGEAVPAGNPILADRGIMAPIYPHEYRLEMSYRALVDGLVSGARKQNKKPFGKLTFTNRSEED